MFGTLRYQGLMQEKEFITASVLEPISCTSTFMEKSGDFERCILGFAGEAVKNNCSMTYAM